MNLVCTVQEVKVKDQDATIVRHADQQRMRRVWLKPALATCQMSNVKIHDTTSHIQTGSLFYCLLSLSRSVIEYAQPREIQLRMDTAQM